MTKDIEKDTIASALNTIKAEKQKKGVLPKDDKKIIIVNGIKDYSGKSLKVQKGLRKNGQDYIYKAGTNWEDIDEIGKKNIDFSDSDFN